MLDRLKAQPIPAPLLVGPQRVCQPIALPDDYEVYDFTQGYDPDRPLKSAYGIGRYNEPRPTMYAGDQFTAGDRHIHMGIDIAAPAGTAVRAFFSGEIYGVADHQRPFDYGPTLITKHSWGEQTLYALHGHLSQTSLTGWRAGQRIEQGEVLGWVGGPDENGGWNPHLHFQLSMIEPLDLDLPGAVGVTDLEWALRVFPDPQDVLGALYDPFL